MLVRRWRNTDSSSGYAGAEPVDRTTARWLLDAALRRGDVRLARDLAGELGLNPNDREKLISRTHQELHSLTGGMLLLWVRRERTVENKPALPDDVPYQEDESEIETHWIEIELTDEEGTPIPKARYEVTLPSGHLVTGKLDDSGRARIDDIPPGDCKV
ncbi:MAG: carboxypeptidase regulatory-like domain-containing protein, partial [Myxococcales bacterium]|nr:carboxypeptidase regulatory-like domain-containing protein [Myxococcales bacterium]